MSSISNTKFSRCSRFPWILGFIPSHCLHRQSRRAHSNSSSHIAQATDKSLRPLNCLEHVRCWRPQSPTMASFSSGKLKKNKLCACFSSGFGTNPQKETNQPNKHVQKPSKKHQTPMWKKQKQKTSLPHDGRQMSNIQNLRSFGGPRKPAGGPLQYIYLINFDSMVWKFSLTIPRYPTDG